MKQSGCVDNGYQWYSTIESPINSYSIQDSTKLDLFTVKFRLNTNSCLFKSANTNCCETTKCEQGLVGIFVCLFSVLL